MEQKTSFRVFGETFVLSNTLPTGTGALKASDFRRRKTGSMNQSSPRGSLHEFSGSAAMSLRSRPNTTVFADGEWLKSVRCSIAPRAP